jgi:hypothetical protein
MPPFWRVSRKSLQQFPMFVIRFESGNKKHVIITVEFTDRHSARLPQLGGN